MALSIDDRIQILSQYFGIPAHQITFEETIAAYAISLDYYLVIPREMNFSEAYTETYFPTLIASNYIAAGFTEPVWIYSIDACV